LLYASPVDAKPFKLILVAMERHRIMVIGNNVTTVQCVSRYCLKKNLEVFPYYGIPLVEDITLFAPHALVLCLPIPENFQHQIHQPYILWSEPIIDEKLPMVTNFTDLYICLQNILQASN
jgi:hypothetical protein